MAIVVLERKRSELNPSNFYYITDLHDVQSSVTSRLKIAQKTLLAFSRQRALIF